MEHRPILILGGGITALAASHYLEKAGCSDYLILERHLNLGGLCRSVTKNGFVWDYTGHVLWRMDPETRQFYEDVLGNNLTWVERKAAVYTHGQFVPYPFQTHLKNLPPEIVYECLSGFLNRERHLRGVDFESWSLSMFGDGIHRNFMVPFNEKLFGVPLREMTWDWCQDVPVPTIDQILRGAILGETFTLKGNAKFGYPKVGGMQAMVDELAKKVPAKNVMTGRTVSKIDIENRVVTHVDYAGNENQIHYDKLITTIPFRKLLKVVTPQDGKLRDFAFRLKSNNVACVMLGFEKPLSDLHWLYVPEREFSFYRVGFTNNLVESVAPFNCGSLTAEITIPDGVTMSSNDFVKSTLEGLKAMGLWHGDRENPVAAMHVEFISPAYVIYDLNRRAIPKMIDELNSINVFPAGRFGRWEYSSVSDNVTDARHTVKAVLK